jgi:hypothetical protein
VGGTGQRRRGQGRPRLAEARRRAEGSSAVGGQAPAAVTRKTIQPAAVDKLIADLDDDSFPVREKATHELEQAGQAAKEALVKALAAKPAPEKRRRLEELLERLGRTGPTRELLRPLRAVELLERIGTPEARQVLEALGKGDAGARLTQEATAALRRLGPPARP